ncbi:MAG TPA: hypothetical protein VNO26_01540 [Candidatus Limnocylindria bacterium]|nr:hypothetical protein [Candidatus Limnocylindria bacterium]
MTSTLRHDYFGGFDPALTLASFSRQALATLGREYLLHGHLQDRVGLPGIMARFGDDAMTRIAIDEWMAASPIYSKRMQRALGFSGSDVGTIFKNIQLDIGAAHQFMDFRYRLDSPTYGEFWLARCGALVDVEPFGEARVRSMCHDIEDPTFDATAAAAHPCAKVRSIHRPPREPADRVPHCHWKVFIDGESVPAVEHPALERVRRARIASVPIVVPDGDAQPGGWADYGGAFDPDFQLEDLSHRALVTALQEFAVQSHLLARAFLLCTAERFGDACIPALAAEQWTGIAGLTAERLRAALAIASDDIEAVAKLFQVHPAFHPRTYVDLRVEVTGPRTARLEIGDCPALQEGDAYSWFAGLTTAPHPALDAIARLGNPRARCLPTDAARGLAWNVIIDPAAMPAPEPGPVQLAKLSSGARFVFERRRPLRA